jgi:hypothetical protein
MSITLYCPQCHYEFYIVFPYGGGGSSSHGFVYVVRMG